MTTKWIAGMGVAVLALAAGCAGTSEAKRDAEGAIAGLEASAEGMIVGVQGEYLEVRSAEDPEAPPMRFQRTEDTDLVRDERPFSWPELSEGMPVRVSYEAKGGSEQATRVEILTGADADEVRTKTQGSGGWTRPEGVGTPPDRGSVPPSEMPGVGERKEGMDPGDEAMEPGDDEDAW